ncbi:MAG: hypothetical protein HY898_30150 [Deltaproteobacteria bacterium]|nr:hypothetical protein [Deltaproteobacteria bacterium]
MVSRATWALLLCVLPCACSAGAIRRFPLRDPLWVDPDLQDVAVPCRPDPRKANATVCGPEPYESSFAWDAADNLVFRPLSRFFAVDPAGEAVNVNSLDETPDSSWFTNRLGRRSMTEAEVEQGACGDDPGLEVDGPDGSWEIDQGKMNGANPGFRIQWHGVRYMLKSDPREQPERATGATVIAGRLYHAAGWWVPCERIVYFRRSLLRLKAGLTVTDNSGVTRPFDDGALDKLLENASRRGPLIRMVASKWLPGRALGPFTYAGVRDDDPSDVVLHEDRRDLRGARLIAAWLNHFDSREQNSMTTWMSPEPKRQDMPLGHALHWYMDLGDCFGSEWDWEELSRRLGHAYYLDIPYLTEDFLTLGIQTRPWDRAERSRDGEIFGFFHSRDFEPQMWRGGYPNPAFARMSERDGAWAARILARITPAHVQAAVRAGSYTNPQHSSFLVRHLIARQRALLERYLAKLSPITDWHLQGELLCGLDLSRKLALTNPSRYHYAVAFRAGEALSPLAPLADGVQADGTLCIPLPHRSLDARLPADAPARYLLVDVFNGHAPGPSRVHLYDLGAAGFKLVGVERPEA